MGQSIEQYVVGDTMYVNQGGTWRQQDISDQNVWNQQQLAQQQMGAQAMRSGALAGANIETAVRNQMADRLKKGLADRGIEATVDTKGSQAIEITIDNPATAAWNQGVLAWLVAKVMPSSIEYTIAPSIRETLEESGIEGEVEVK